MTKNDRLARLKETSKHLKLKSYTFDVDIFKIYLIPTLGPCLKTKAWSFFIPIYGNYEAIELKDNDPIFNKMLILEYNFDDTDEIKEIISGVLNENNEVPDNDEIRFYVNEFRKQLLKINSKISFVEYKIQDKDLIKIGLNPNRTGDI